MELTDGDIEEIASKMRLSFIVELQSLQNMGFPRDKAFDMVILRMNSGELQKEAINAYLKTKTTG